MKPYSEACERNKGPILTVLQAELTAARQVLEIGSGTGQHAVFFAAAMPWLEWQPSDLPEQHAGMRAWLAEAALPNLRAPLSLDVEGAWPAGPFDALFSANTAHIVSWPAVTALIAGAGRVLAPAGRLLLYGPFNYAGRYTSASNAQFDQWLHARDPRSGIRGFEAVDALARAQGLVLQADHPMPANNRLLVWARED